MARGRIRLSGSPSSSPFKQTFRELIKSRGIQDVKRALLKSFRVSGLPIRIRPAFIVLTSFTLVTLSILGVHPTLASKISPPVPFSDKLLHFFCFFLASAQFYAIWSIEENARRVWHWRWWNEAVSCVVCLGFGSIGSEIVQAMLPYKTFQWGDIFANGMGSALGIFTARSIVVSHRRAVELRRLYQPLDLTHSPDSSDSDSDSEDDTLLQNVNTGSTPRSSNPTNGHRKENNGTVNSERSIEEGRGRAEAQLGLNKHGDVSRGDKNNKKRVKIESNPWDDGDEVFELGEDDEEGEQDQATTGHQNQGRTLE